MCLDLRFKHPFTCIISGPSGSCKSSICINCCKISSRLQGPRLTVAFLGATESRTLSPLDVGKRLQFQEGVPDNFANDGNKPYLIILDDPIKEAYSGAVCKRFTKRSHRRNSVILITQNLFHQGNHCRTISLKAKYIVLLKNTGGKNQFPYLARKGYPEDSAGLYKACLEATEKPHGCLM